MNLLKFARPLAISIMAAGAGAIAGEAMGEQSYSCSTIPAFNAGVNGGTRGLGVSVGYQVSEHVRIRLREACMNYDYSEQWGSTASRIPIHGNNAGLLLDYFPFCSHFDICTGLNICESKAEYRAHLRQETASHNIVHSCGRDYKITDGDSASIYPVLQEGICVVF